MNNNTDLLACPIFDNLQIENRDKFISELAFTKKYCKKYELIFSQNDICDKLYLLMRGSVKTEMITESGSLLGIEIIKAPRPLAPAFLFSDNNRFPVDVTALEEVEIVCIPRQEVMRLMSENPNFMQEYMKYNANRTQFLTDRLQTLSIKTIKKKIAHYLLELSGGDQLNFDMNRNQTELADFLGVTRPSLARTLGEMEQDGIIKMDKKQITILNIKQLKDITTK